MTAAKPAKIADILARHVAGAANSAHMGQFQAEQRALDYAEQGNGLHMWFEVGRAIKLRRLTGPEPLISFLKDRIAELEKRVADPPRPKKVDAEVARAMGLKFEGRHAGSVFKDYALYLRNREIAAQRDEQGPLVDLTSLQEDPRVRKELKVTPRTRQRAYREVSDRIKKRTGQEW